MVPLWERSGRKLGGSLLYACFGRYKRKKIGDLKMQNNWIKQLNLPLHASFRIGLECI